MIQSTTLLAQLPGATEATPSAGVVVVVGFLFAITVLALLAAVTSAMGAWFTKQAAASAAKAASAAQTAVEASSRKGSGGTPEGGASPQSTTAEDDPALVAVIAAAVHTVIGDQPHRVVSIRSAGPGWAQEGRRQIFSSHRVR